MKNKASSLWETVKSWLFLRIVLSYYILKKTKN